MNALFTPWLNLSLWAVWHRVLPVEPITLEDKPLAEVVMQVAPDATPLDGFPYGLHLRQTPDGVEVAPAARSWRNARGEIGLGWVAWQNALIDDPERQCKDVIDAAAPVQWVLAAVYAQPDTPDTAPTRLALEIQARTLHPPTPAEVAPRFLAFPQASTLRDGGMFELTRAALPDAAHWRGAVPPWAGHFSRSVNAELAALVQRLAPVFPHPGAAPRPNLQIEEDWTEREAQRRQWMETIYLPYWQRLAPAYAAALAEPWGQDSGRLKVVVEDWPEDFDSQQQALTQLLVTSKLRQSWRSQAQWRLAQRTLYTDGMRRVSAALEQEHHECARPLAEIPLYWGFIRATCQQLICLPVAQHQAMHNNNARYDPATVDEATASRLAHRVARLFNAPPTLPPDDWAYTPSRDGSIIWATSPGSLTSDGPSNHGMTDRLLDDYGRPRPATYHGEGNTPTWRFDGFCGQLRVTLESGEDWYVTVLAPSHFVGALLRLPQTA